MSEGVGTASSAARLDLLDYGFGLGLHDDLRPGQCLAIGIAAFAIQMWAARVWFRNFHYGPLEWLWRAATRTTLSVPFIRSAVPAAA